MFIQLTKAGEAKQESVKKELSEKKPVVSELVLLSKLNPGKWHKVNEFEGQYNNLEQCVAVLYCDELITTLGD